MQALQTWHVRKGKKQQRMQRMRNGEISIGSRDCWSSRLRRLSAWHLQRQKRDSCSTSNSSSTRASCAKQASMRLELATRNVKPAGKVPDRRKKSIVTTVSLARPANFLRRKHHLNASNVIKGNSPTWKKVLSARLAQKGNSKRT